MFKGFFGQWGWEGLAFIFAVATGYSFYLWFQGEKALLSAEAKGYKKKAKIVFGGVIVAAVVAYILGVRF